MHVTHCSDCSDHVCRCWLKTSTGFIWSFVGPVAAVMLVNIVMLGVAIYMMYNHAKMVANMKHKETTRLENIRFVLL